MKSKIKPVVGSVAAATVLLVSLSGWAGAATIPPTYDTSMPAALSTAQELMMAASPLHYGPPTTYLRYASAFPSSWSQLAGNQEHNPVYPMPEMAPSFLARGVFWAAPLTGLEFLRLARAFHRYPVDGGQAWGSEAAQWLGNVTGVSVVDGIVFAEESMNEMFALDAATGTPIWRAKTVNGDMGTPLVESINGRPTIFVASGDVGFTLQHAVDFANNGNPPGPTVRGANFSAVYAIDGLTGKVLWRFDTQGEAMPTPVYKNNTLFFNTGDGHVYAVNPANGALISSFSNPGWSSMSSGNWYVPTSGPWAGHLLIIFGTQDPNHMMAVDESNPAAPKLAWEYTVPYGINTGNGDVPPVVDPKLGIVLSDALVNDVAAGGTKAHPILNLDVFAINANTGQLMWSHYAGNGLVAKPSAFKGSVPMVYDGNLYVGDLLNETYQSYSETTGTLRWTTSLVQPNAVNEPRGSGIIYEGHLIFAEGRNIYTLDPHNGSVDNRFSVPGYFADWGIVDPVAVGDEVYMGSISGWIFGMPIDYIMTHHGLPFKPFPLGGNFPPPQLPSYYDPSARPTSDEAASFPSTWLAYAGGTDHNGYVPTGPSNIEWQTPLRHAVALTSGPRDAAIYGPRVATVMTDLAFGVGTGVSPANGLIYVGAGRYNIDAINATTGKILWTYNTINNNFGQPLVTPKTVVVGSGDPWFNFASVGAYATHNPVHLGASFQALHGLDPMTGREEWTFYNRGTDMMTPLYYNGNLYWVNGNGNVWAINADTGNPVEPFVVDGNPTLHLPGYNTIDSGNIYQSPNGGPAIMVVGTMNSPMLYGINLSTDTVVWSQQVSTSVIPYSGFGDVTPVTDQQDGLIIGDVLVSGGTTSSTTALPSTGFGSTMPVSPRNVHLPTPGTPYGPSTGPTLTPPQTTGSSTASLLAYAVNAQTGQVVWTQNLGSGYIPDGFTGSVPVLNNGTVYLGNPLTGSEFALNAQTGTPVWSEALGQTAEAPGVVVGSDLIQPAGPYLFTLDTQTGKILNQFRGGGYYLDNNPTVVGQTLYIGNAWGWVQAFPLSLVTAGQAAPVAANSFGSMPGESYPVVLAPNSTTFGAPANVDGSVTAPDTTPSTQSVTANAPASSPSVTPSITPSVTPTPSASVSAPSQAPAAAAGFVAAITQNKLSFPASAMMSVAAILAHKPSTAQTASMPRLTIRTPAVSALFKAAATSLTPTSVYYVIENTATLVTEAPHPGIERIATPPNPF